MSAMTIVLYYVESITFLEKWELVSMDNIDLCMKNKLN